MIVRVLLLALAFTGCNKRDSFDRFDLRTSEGRLERAQASIGTGEGATIWKCVGSLDEQRMVALALEDHPQHGLMLLVNRVDFSAAPDSYTNEGLYFLEVSADVSSPKYAVASRASGRELIVYEPATAGVRFYADLTHAAVTEIRCSDHTVVR